MKNIIKVLSGVVIGMAIMFVGMKFITPFGYQYDQKDGAITFNVDDEIISDYELVEWRFDGENKGSTFKVYFEENGL